MKHEIRILRLVFKSFGKLYWIPVIVAFLVVPLFDVRYYLMAGGAEASVQLVNSVMQRLLPFFAVWWVYFALKEYMEGEGRELLYVYTANLRRIRIGVVGAWLWYLCHIAVLLAVHAVWYSDMLWIFLQLAAESLLFAGVYALFTVLFKNTGIALLLVAVYYLAISGFNGDTVFVYISVFQFETVASPALLLGKYLWVGLVGAAFLVVAFLVLQKRKAVFAGEK